MFFKFPKDDQRFSWTNHIKNKMLFYGLSEQKIRSVLNAPKRKEEGIAPQTVAVMKRNDRGKKKEEIWVMYLRRPDINVGGRSPDRERRGRLLMISAWRYPGISKPGTEIPIPNDIRKELGL